MRLVCWFSCGAASAVAAQMALEINRREHKCDEVVVVYSEVKEEHPDNKRFLKDCEDWFGVPITILRNEKYEGSIVQCFDRNRYMAGIAGAPCTRLLKKEIRKKFERQTDIQVFGYTSEEKNRLDRFIDANNGVHIWAPLIDYDLSKGECLKILANAGIELPMMYRLGYHNNNCVGCVKGGAGYWNKIRKDFPEVFRARAEQSRRLGARLCKVKGKRVFLDELPSDAGNYPQEIMPECGIACELVSDMLEVKDDDD